MRGCKKVNIFDLWYCSCPAWQRLSHDTAALPARVTALVVTGARLCLPMFVRIFRQCKSRLPLGLSFMSTACLHRSCAGRFFSLLSPVERAELRTTLPESPASPASAWSGQADLGSGHHPDPHARPRADARDEDAPLGAASSHPAPLGHGENPIHHARPFDAWGDEHAGSGAAACSELLGPGVDTGASSGSESDPPPPSWAPQARQGPLLASRVGVPAALRTVSEGSGSSEAGRDSDPVARSAAKLAPAAGTSPSAAAGAVAVAAGHMGGTSASHGTRQRAWRSACTRLLQRCVAALRRRSWRWMRCALRLD